MDCIADLSKENPSLHLIQDRVHEYGKSHSISSSSQNYYYYQAQADRQANFADTTQLIIKTFLRKYKLQISQCKIIQPGCRKFQQVLVPMRLSLITSST